MNTCRDCGSAAINPGLHGRKKGIDLSYCDVCYWRYRAETALAKVEELTEQILVMCRKCRIGLKDCKKCPATKHMTSLPEVKQEVEP